MLTHMLEALTIIGRCLSICIKFKRSATEHFNASATKRDRLRVIMSQKGGPILLTAYALHLRPFRLLIE